MDSVTFLLVHLVCMVCYVTAQSDDQCYSCSFTAYNGIETGSKACSDQDGPVDKSILPKVACPYQYCVKYRIDSGNYYHVSRACLPACETLGESTKYSYENHEGRQYCCNGHLCNSAVPLYSTLQLSLILAFVGLLSL